MIVVDDPGTWSAVYPPLLHAEWNGWTYTDTIFPFFLFLAGASLALSLARRREQGRSRRALLLHLALRAGSLVALGLALNLASFFAFRLEHVRIPGVLQRIGVCLLVAGAIALLGGARAAGWAAAAFLLGYWALMRGGPLEVEGNPAARVDRAVFGVHTWKPGFDPEGLLSTVPAIATTLLGVLAGERLRSPGPPARRAVELSIAGAAGVVAGLFWGRSLPINKNLWTSSYALLMSGLAALALGICVAGVDAKGRRRWTAPLLWLGRNAIAAFTLSTLGAIALIAVRIDRAGGRPRSLWRAIYQTVFDRFTDPRLGSLLFALAYLGVWILVFGWLYRRRIFIRI